MVQVRTGEKTLDQRGGCLAPQRGTTRLLCCVVVEANEGRVVMANGERGRYVRLWTRGSSPDENYHYTEVKMFGK